MSIDYLILISAWLGRQLSELSDVLFIATIFRNDFIAIPDRLALHWIELPLSSVILIDPKVVLI